MKRTKLLSIALSAIALLAVVGCSNEPKIKTVLNPTIAERSDSALTVDKVILTDSMTIVDFAYKCSDIGSWLYTPKSAYIVANSKKYKVIGSKNMPIANDLISEAIHYRTVTYSLIFPPIPFDTDSISFYERSPKSKNSGSWWIKGISLQSKSSTIAYKTRKDSKEYAAKMKAMNEPMESSYDYSYEEAQDTVALPMDY